MSLIDLHSSSPALGQAPKVGGTTAVWLGFEDSEHVQGILYRYTEELSKYIERPPNSREPPRFIGSVSRSFVDSGGGDCLLSFDVVRVYLRDFVRLGEAMRFAVSILVKTAWCCSDGLPVNVCVIESSGDEEEDYSHVIPGNCGLVNFLRCLPLANGIDEFRFVSSSSFSPILHFDGFSSCVNTSLNHLQLLFPVDCKAEYFDGDTQSFNCKAEHLDGDTQSFNCKEAEDVDVEVIAYSLPGSEESIDVMMRSISSNPLGMNDFDFDNFPPPVFHDADEDDWGNEEEPQDDDDVGSDAEESGAGDAYGDDEADPEEHSSDSDGSSPPNSAAIALSCRQEHRFQTQK